jgi:membrane associated rhomboid family serine protease
MSMLIPIRDLNPYRRFPVWTVALIAVNAVVFIAVSRGLAISQDAAYQYGAIPCDVLDRCPQLSAQLDDAFAGHSPIFAIFTSMFMHANLLHIGFNMLFLWVFGNNVEDRLGRIRFPIFYLLCGLGAAFAHILASPTSAVPTIGASGAVSGILGAYAVVWPSATIISIIPIFILIFFTVRTPAWLMIGLWFVIQLFSGVGSLGQTPGASGGVAYLAHVGGFLTGLVLIIPFGGRRAQRRDIAPAWPDAT